MNPPKIVHVIGTPNPGGVQVNLLTLLKSEALSGFRHDILCLIDDQGGMRRDFEAAGAEIRFCPLRWPQGRFTPSYRVDQFLRNHLYFAFPFRLASLLKKMDASLVHTHISDRVGLQAQAVLTHARRPWVWTLHGLYRSRGEDVSGWGRAARLVNEGNAAVTAVCGAAMRELTSYETLSPNKQRVIFNALDLNRFASGGKRAGTRARLGVPRDALVFGTAGRLVPVKRHDLLVRAASDLLKSGLDAYFLIAGRGELRDELAGLISELGAGARVHLVGHQDDMPAFLSALDVFVLSSDSEALPLALMEACAAGLPCIASAVGGVTDILGEGQGLLIPPDSAQALTDAMRHMSHAEAREKYARTAKAAAEKFSHEKVAAQYAELYRELIGGRP